MSNTKSKLLAKYMESLHLDKPALDKLKQELWQGNDALQRWWAYEVKVAEGNPDASKQPESPWEQIAGVEHLAWYGRSGVPYRQHNELVADLRYHNIRDLLARFFLTVHAQTGRMSNWRGFCIGITSLASNPLLRSRGYYDSPQHVPMFDYDGKNIKTKVKKDIKQLQKKYRLGNATIYTTKSGLHVYFFSDVVPWKIYREMLQSVDCCRGFAKATVAQSYAVLRVSAKYTEFDIEPYKVVTSPHQAGKRPGRKAAVVQALLDLGRQCGTHFASLYPQWARFQEDPRPWKPSTRKKVVRRVKKIPPEELDYKKWLAESAKLPPQGWVTVDVSSMGATTDPTTIQWNTVSNSSNNYF